jgi:hypothetical protein
MSETISIDEARELFAKTTRGDCAINLSCIYQGMKKVAEANCDQDGLREVFAWAEFISAAHNNWLAMLDEIEQLRKSVAKQQSELGEYWRAAVAVEAEDDTVSANGLADLHSIRTGNSYSQVGTSVAEMLLNQRDALAVEVKRMRAEAKSVIEAIGGDTAEFDVAIQDRIPLDSMVSEAMAQKDNLIETTYVPPFVGADEIEIAGVEYVRKNLRKSQSVNERLLAAAKKYRCVSRAADFAAQDELSNAIAAAEAEIEERLKPVTEDWLKSRGWDHCGMRGRCNIYSPALGVESIRIEFGLKVTLLFDSLCKTSPTRGDVIIVDDLLRVLGGAK